MSTQWDRTVIAVVKLALYLDAKAHGCFLSSGVRSAAETFTEELPKGMEEGISINDIRYLSSSKSKALDVTFERMFQQKTHLHRVQ